MTKNPLLRRLLGEAIKRKPVDSDEAAAPPDAEMRDTLTGADDDVSPVDNSEVPPEGDEVPPEALASVKPETQQLIQQWQNGEHLDVAIALLFSSADYKAFVQVLFAIGEEDGMELGGLLDELAEREKLPPPQTPPEYQSVLQRVSGADQAEETL